MIFGKSSNAHLWRGIIEEYRHRLPVSRKTPVVSLQEGGTPLIYGCVLSDMLDNEVWVKVEGCNPTGSFKDRGMTMAMSKAAEDGAKVVICASTGNTSASAAAYATKAGMIPAVLIPEGKIAMGKLAQAVIHGAKILQVDGNFDDCLTLARELSENYPVALVNSVNPYRIQGQKTASFEIVDALGFAPDIHALPVGNAGNITAYWMGYQEYQKDKISKKDLVQLHSQLATLSIDQRIEQFQLKADRADVIVPALEIYIAALAALEQDQIVVPKIGLADGILLELFLKNTTL